MSNDSHIFGIRTVLEALQSGKNIDKIWIQKGLQGSLFKELLSVLKSHQLTPNYVPAEKLNRMTSKNHQGVIASISPVTYWDLADLVEVAFQKSNTPIFLLLDHVSDVRNFGAIARTAECTGVSGIIVPRQGSAAINADAIKTSAGALFSVPVCKVDHLNDAAFFLQSSGVKIIAATEKTSTELHQVDMTSPIALVMGSEDKGISASLLKICDEKARLPMLGTIGSLNVSVACAVFLYEIIRQRQK